MKVSIKVEVQKIKKKFGACFLMSHTIGQTPFTPFYHIHSHRNPLLGKK